MLALLGLVPSVMAQELPTVGSEDYDRWETFLFPTVSPTADWIAYRVRRNDQSAELRVLDVETDSTFVVPWGEGAVFSPDGRFLAWRVGVSNEERDARGPDDPVHLTAEVLNLVTGQRRSLGEAASLAFDPSGRYLALERYAEGEPAGRGADVRVLDLLGRSEVTLANVTAHSWSDSGSVLAAIVASGADEANGVQIYDAAAGVLRGLDSSGSRYAQLTWSEAGTELSVLRSDSVASKAEEGPFTVLAWLSPLASDAMVALTSSSAAIPDSLWIVPHRRPAWHAGSRRVEVGLRPRPEVEEPGEGEEASEEEGAEPEADADDASTVQIWHSSDVRVIPRQQAMAGSDKRRSLLAVWTPATGEVVTVGTDLLASTQLLGDGQWAVEESDAAYAFGAKFGRRYRDVHSVDLSDGTRRSALQRVRYEWANPDRGQLVWFDGDDYHVVDLASGAVRNLTESIDAAFTNEQWDTPTDGLLPPYGFGGWEEEGVAAYVYDRFDVWRISLIDGEATRLTRGADEEIVHRLQDVRPDLDTYPADEPLLFQIRDEWTEARGFARWTTDEGYDRLLLEDRSHGFLQRADSVDRFVYRVESREESPDLMVADADFSNRQTLAESNPFQSEYAWTRSEMVDYVDGAGDRQHGVLLYPANHDPSVRYPMIVYAYEILSPQRHSWENPNERDYYNFTAWTQNGYFVLLPDIVFRARDPGVSMAEAVGAAVEAVNDQGLIDRERVGFVGHSWGGYHATYLAARTELFATTIAGAPLTDFISFMGQIHWNPGIPEVDHWETGQARMEVPYWEDPDAHERNSPIHGVHEMTTPLLMAHGDDDGVVEFFQATEFYNFARRAEKQMVLLVYGGEDHGFSQEANQIDYHRRILEWFGHYLKGEPAPSWITDGVSWDQHSGERDRVRRGTN